MVSKEKKTGEETIRDIYDFLTWLYAATAVWRVNSPNKFKRIAYNAYKVLTYISYFYHVAVIYLGISTKYQDLQMFAFTLTYLIISAAGVSKIMYLESHVGALQKLEIRLENDFHLPWMGKHEREKVVKKRSAEMLSAIVTFLLIATAIGVLVTIFIPLFPDSKLKFILPTPFDHLSKTSLFLPIYFHQAFSIIIFITSFVVFDLIFIGIIIRLCDHMTIIKLNLKEIGLSMGNDSGEIGRESGIGSAQLLYEYGESDCYHYDGKKDKVKQDWWMREKHARVIKNCITHHQAVYREIKLIGSIFSYSTTMYFLLGPVLMGLLAYVILSGTATIDILIQQAGYVIPAALFVFMVCYFGTELSVQCENVRFAFYDCPWYEMDMRTRKLIVIALITMEKTGKLRAGKFMDIALTTFLSSLKATYNIVTFLKNTS